MILTLFGYLLLCAGAIVGLLALAGWLLELHRDHRLARAEAMRRHPASAPGYTLRFKRCTCDRVNAPAWVTHRSHCELNLTQEPA